MDRIEAELQALRDKWEDECSTRKDAVLDDPIELFQALAPVGMTVAGDEKRIYELLGLLTKQLISLDKLPLWITAAMPIDWAQMLETADELSELIEGAVEDYAEEDHGE